MLYINFTRGKTVQKKSLGNFGVMSLTYDKCNV